MSDITAITSQTDQTTGATALAGIKTAVTNLNTDKAEISGQVFTGAISATNLSGTNTGNETATTIGALIGGSADATPNDTDYVATSLTAGGILKKITWTNVKAFLKTYFDTLYAPVTIVKATGAELDTGTDDVKFATAKALKDSHNVPSVAPSTSGNVMTSNGTDWTSASPSAISGILGTWASATADGAGHQVATDGFLVGYGEKNNATNGTIIIKTDVASTPTTTVAYLGVVSGTASSFCVPVKKGHYYSITKSANFDTNGSSAAYWIPLGA